MSPRLVWRLSTLPLRPCKNLIPLSNVPHVALLIETSRAYGRGILQGIVRYQREHGPWSIYFEPHGLEAPPPPWLKKWHGDGILCRINNAQTARIILQTGLPAVDLRFAVRGLALPGVGIDYSSVVSMAFEHLTNCCFR